MALGGRRRRDIILPICQRVEYRNSVGTRFMVPLEMIHESKRAQYEGREVPYRPVIFSNAR